MERGNGVCRWGWCCRWDVGYPDALWGAVGQGSPCSPRGAWLQVRYLNTYYERIRARVGQELQRQRLQEEYDWLQRSTEPFPLGGAATTTDTSTTGTLALTMLLSALLPGLQA